MMPFFLPAAAAVLLLACSYCGYVAARSFGAGRRRMREIAAIAKLNIPAEAKKPSAFDDIAIIDQAQKSAHQSAFDYLGAYRAVALVACAIPPIGVLLLASSLIVEGRSEEWAVGFVAAEVLILIGLLILVQRMHRPTGSWHDSRVRSELLRREQYLCLAVTGPYSDSPFDARMTLAQERVAVLQKAGHIELEKLAVVDVTGFARAWTASAGSSVAVATSAIPDLPERLACYFWYRVGKQLAWLSLAHEINEGWEKASGRILKAALVAAIGAAGGHLAMLVARRQHLAEPSEAIELGLTLLAIFLPVLSMAILACRELFAFRLIAASYRRTRSDLETVQEDLKKLQSRISTVPSPLDDERRFQSIVLRTEAMLANELRVWSIVMSRDELEVSV